MKKKLFYAFIAIGIVAQFVVLTSNIVLSEIVLRFGTVCRFQTAPVDPFDAFRGQYVALSFRDFEREGIHIPFSKKWSYVQIGTNANGFAVAERVSPTNDVSSPYLKVRHKYNRIHLPFDRYYMPERLAPQAEEAYRQANRSGKRDAAAVVRIWKGRAVIEDLEIEGVPIRKVLKKQAEEKQ